MDFKNKLKVEVANKLKIMVIEKSEIKLTNTAYNKKTLDPISIYTFF